jgi:hypothetical protein
MTHTVLIIENMIHCPALWQLLKGSPIIARILSLSKSSSATGETKSKIIRIVTNLSKDSPPLPPPRDMPRQSRYEDVNIRLYPGSGEVPKPYIPHAPKPVSRRIEFTNIDNQGTGGRRQTGMGSNSRAQEGLRKSGYDTVHNGSRGSNRDYNNMEEQKVTYEPTFDTRPRQREAPIMSNSEKLSKSRFEQQNSFGDDYNFPLDGGARRDPVVRIPFNDNLLHDY